MNTRHHYLSLLRTFALATLTAAAVAACTDDNGDPAGNEPITPADGIPVTFTANINPGSDADPAGAPGTRTVLTPTTEGGFTVTWKGKEQGGSYDQISIWAANQQNTWAGSSYGHSYVPTTSAASSALEPYNEGEKLTLPSSGEWNFTAIYGYNSMDTGKGIAFISPLTQSAPGNTEHIAEKDFSVATAAETVADNSEMPAFISFKFKHMLSALQLQVKNGTGAELSVEEIRLSVSGDQIACQRAYDVVTGKWEAGEGTKSDYLQLEIKNPVALANDGTVQKFHMLLFPGYENKTLTITVITDRGEYTLTKTAPASPGFEAGKNYLTDITIKSTGLQANETWTEIISTPEQLAAFREKVNGGDNYDGKTVRLTKDIPLTGEWTPIGTDDSPFWGTFDGGGYHISGLNVDNSNADCAGLFGYVLGGTVRNLRVSGMVTTTGQYAGGIAGYLSSSSTVENCIFSGTVNGNSNVGGIAGYNSNSRIAGCHTEGSVTATAGCAGGIAGASLVYSSIDDCYSEAEVKALSETGGIIGQNQSRCTVTHCYATGKVSGKSSVGGIVGNSNSATVTGCIALNPGLTRTSDANNQFGRIVGFKDGGSVTSCAAYDGMTIKDVSNNDITGTTGEHGTALTREQCLTKNTYTGFAEPTATKPGWAFDTATPWAYLPWNSAFESFHNISETDYCIPVPDHLKGTGTVN